MNNLGIFSHYAPESPPVPGATYVKNEDGTDWYTIAWDKERIAGNIYAGTDTEGRIICVTDDGSALFPVDMTVWEIPVDEAPEGILTDGYNARIIDGVYILDQVVIARGTQSHLLKEAKDKIAILQDAVDLNMATEDEKFLLIEWKKYRVLLTRIKPEDAPDIDWPVKPE
ncbi:tail fiber assembly protein [Enterobacter sp. Lyrl_3]|uniref:tail fiber assembly protein n=1 Tax=Enterobacter sp. Lyrl_3 TaxID=3110922 RepID=UPI003F7F804C